MNYISTRNKKLNYNFEDIFLRGLAPDGGLFLPKNIRKYSKQELKDLGKLNYIEMGANILSNFCGSNLDINKITSLLNKAYSNFDTKEVVKIKKIGQINLLELYHGPTLAFKDIAMQVIGLMYNELGLDQKK